ncbi:MAG: PilN domain-containing protein [Kiritimatiellae bacterium]|nr:PilN domain-containing protein [Kiritimatiellia bacterium]
MNNRKDMIKALRQNWRRLRKKMPAFRALFRRNASAGRNPVTGLRIADDLPSAGEGLTGFIEWTTLRETKSGVEILAVNNVSLPGDSAGQSEGEGRGGRLKMHCAEINGAVSLGITPDKMLMRVAELPTTDPAEMNSMIRLQVDASSPFPDDRIVVSHEILRRDESGTRVLIVAATKDLIEKTGLLFKNAGLDVQRIDAQVMAWWHLISEHVRTYGGGRCLFLVLEPWGGVWIAAQGGAPLAFRAVSPAGDMPFAEFAREVARDGGALVLSLDSEYGGAPLVGLEAWGRGLETGVLSSALSEELAHEAKVNSLDSLPPLSEGLARRFLGTNLSPVLTRAGDGGQPVIDLVPETWRSAVIAQRMRRRLLVSTVGVLAVWLAAFAGFFGAYQYQHYRLAKLEEKQNALHQPAEEVRMMQNQTRAFERYLDRKNSALECLREISQHLPNGVLLTSFQFKKGKTVAIRGEAIAVDAIYDYKQALDKSPMFARIEMGSIQPGKRKNTSVNTFQMTLHLKEQP